MGLIVAVIIALVLLKNAVFDLMSRKVYAIAAGEHIISFIALGIIHGVWQ
ncbi:hypothetical protein M6D81_03485 [Paenibacillus sp. J5C_2022]|nr:hypothetical protein [Paenibacillus sp. J5C2022]